MALTKLSARRGSSALSPIVSSPAPEESGAVASALVSRRALQKALGVLWFVDGLLQLFPSMWTSHLSADVIQPITSGQPGIVAAALQPGITLASQHIILTNALITVVQLALGICLLMGKRVREALLGSIAWSVLVWVGGEGMGMLLTGQAGMLTGAPGAVLFYALLALAALPRKTSETEVISRYHLQKALALLWGLAAALQLQPYWWQHGQIVDTIAENQQPGTLNGALLDGSLSWVAGIVGNAEPVVNVAFVAIALLLAVGLAVTAPGKARPLLAVSILLSMVMWWAAQGFGLILTGSSTDVNSGILLTLCALVCWPGGSRSEQPDRYPTAVQFRKV